MMEEERQAYVHTCELSMECDSETEIDTSTSTYSLRTEWEKKSAAELFEVSAEVFTLPKAINMKNSNHSAQERENFLTFYELWKISRFSPSSFSTILGLCDFQFFQM